MDLGTRMYGLSMPTLTLLIFNPAISLARRPQHGANHTIDLETELGGWEPGPVKAIKLPPPGGL